MPVAGLILTLSAMAPRLARAVLATLIVGGYMGIGLSRVETSSTAPVPPSSSAQASASPAAAARTMLDTYCVTCHNQRLKTAGLTLDAADVATPHTNPDVWERVISRLQAGTMPPAGRPRPDAATAESVV